MSWLHHGTMHQFFDSRELLYAEYGADLPSFVQHHIEYYIWPWGTKVETALEQVLHNMGHPD